MTERRAPMQLPAEAVPFRGLCDVHLKLAGAVVLIARSAKARHDERVAAAFHLVEASNGERLQKATGGGRL
jgi:hypothetical protein